MARFDKFLGKIVEKVVGGVIDPGVVPDASTSAKGIIEIATGAEVTAGTDTSRAVVPSTLKTELDKKVDKVAGKGLSTNDYDNTEKAKVAAALTSVPVATYSVLGGVRTRTEPDFQTAVNGGVPTQLPTGVVNISDLADIASLKVDKVAGKGLSTNDYDNTEKAKVGKIELETLAELTGADVSVAPWTQSKWSASGACSLTASGWAASGHQIAYIVITLAAEATLSITGTEEVADDDALSAAGVYECYIKNVDGKKYFRVASFVEAA